MNTTELLSKQNILRGEVYYILPEGKAEPGIMNGGRPGVIVSNDMNNQCSTLVMVVYLSRKPYYELPTNVPIQSTGTKCWAICGQVQTIPKQRVGKFVNQLSDPELENINRAMALALDAKLNLATRDFHGILTQWKERLENSDELIQEEQPDREDVLNEKQYIELQTELKIYKALYDKLLGMIRV